MVVGLGSYSTLRHPNIGSQRKGQERAEISKVLRCNEVGRTERRTSIIEKKSGRGGERAASRKKKAVLSGFLLRRVEKNKKVGQLVPADGVILTRAMA